MSKVAEVCRSTKYSTLRKVVEMFVNICAKLCGVAEDPDHGTNGEIAVKIAGMKNNLEDAEES